MLAYCETWTLVGSRMIMLSKSYLLDACCSPVGALVPARTTALEKPYILPVAKI